MSTFLSLSDNPCEPDLIQLHLTIAKSEHTRSSISHTDGLPQYKHHELCYLLRNTNLYDKFAKQAVATRSVASTTLKDDLTAPSVGVDSLTSSVVVPAVSESLPVEVSSASSDVVDVVVVSAAAVAGPLLSVSDASVQTCFR